MVENVGSASVPASSTGLLGSLIAKYDPSFFESIHKVPTYLPAEENAETIRGIFYVAGLITVVHLILLVIIKARAGTIKGGAEAVGDKTAISVAAWTTSYQITNLLVNLTLGCVGMYYQIMVVPWEESVMNKIVGYEHVKIFSMGQIGYQLWALPIGIFFVGETTAMLVHHVAVICVGSVTAFFTCGFRYFTPYFFGVIEISSVPLAIMNSFKKNPDWVKARPDLYSAVRLVFGITFLLVRVALWTPIFWDFYSLAAMHLYSSKSLGTKVISAVFNLSSLVLTMLQYFWASKIVFAMLKGAGSKTPKKEKKEK